MDDIAEVILPPRPNTETQLRSYEGELRAGALPLKSTSVVAEKSRPVKAGAGKLFGFSVYNTNASSQFILMFDAQTVPANGAVPVATFSVAGSGNLGVYYGSSGFGFTRGMMLANSSTAATLTIGAADCLFSAQYV